MLDLLGRPRQRLAPMIIRNAEVQVQRGVGVPLVIVRSAGAPAVQDLVVVDGDIGTFVGVVAGALRGGVVEDGGRVAQARECGGGDQGEGEEPGEGDVGEHDGRVGGLGG